MNKIRVFGLVALVSLGGLALFTGSADAQSDPAASGDYQRAVGIAKGELADCLSAARKGGNTISDSGAPGANEGDWSIVFCGRQTPTQSPAQYIGGVRLEGWEVVESTCEFPSPTSNPCPTF